MKPKILLIVYLLILLVSAQLILALGVSPAKTIIPFDPTATTYTGKFWVVNNAHEEFTMKLSADGEMGQYITLATTELHFREDTDSLPVEFTVTLPAKIPPGESISNIVLQQELAGNGGSTVSSKIVLKHKIFIQGPYPDKYITAKLNFFESGQEIRMVSEVENLGNKDLQNVQTKFYVNDKAQNQQVLETEATALKTKENKLLDTRVPRTLFDQGEFEVLAVTKYDDQQVEVFKKLLVGKPEIDITYFDKYFTAREINKYSMDLLNKWNTEIDNVFVEVEVKKDDMKIDEFRTKSTAIDAQTTKRINDYFDARNKDSGRYTFDMIVNFWNIYQMDSKTFHSELLSKEELQKIDQNQEFTATGKAAEPSVSASKGEGTSITTILFWILLGIIIAGVSIFIIWRYMHRDEYDGGDEGAL